MRTMKYRAWDHESKQMIYSEFEHDNHFFAVETSGLKAYRIYMDNGDSLNPPEPTTEELKITEYTGLKDKNGKEIYEGDLIKIGHYEDDDCIIHKVEYCADRDYPAFDLEPDTGSESNGLSWAIADASIFEVIGNIHQNPNLIK